MIRDYFQKNKSVLLVTFFIVSLAVCIWSIYGQTLSYPFVFDDLPNIVDNSYIRMHEFSLHSIVAAATVGINSVRFISNLSFGLNYYLGAYNPAGYHLFNIIIHFLNALLVFDLSKRLLVIFSNRHSSANALHIALFAALIWAVNPMQTNAVTYVVQRMTSMMTLFFLLSFDLYLIARFSTAQAAWRRLLYLLAICSGLAAFGCKQNAVMLPIMIVGFEWLISYRSDTHNITRLVTCSLIGMVIVTGAVFWYAGSNPFATIMRGYGDRNFNLDQRLLTESRVIFFYLSLYFLPLPSRLNLNHDFALSNGLLDPVQTLFAVAGIILAGAAIFFLRKKRPLYSFVILWFFGNLVLESSIIPLEIIYEYRVYLPSVFLFLPIVEFIYGRFPSRRKLAYVLLSTLIIVFAVFSWQRNEVWASRVSLWRDVVSKSPKLARGYANLGMALALEGKNKEAKRVLFKSLSLDSHDSNVYLNLGNIYDDQGNYSESLQFLNTALAEKKANLVKIHAVISEALWHLGRYNQALSEANLVLHMNPDFSSARMSKGIALVHLGQAAAAIKIFSTLEKEGVKDVDLYNNWGVAAYKLGKIDEAIMLFKKGLKLDPEHKESHYNLGIAYGAKGMLKEARREMALGM